MKSGQQLIGENQVVIYLGTDSFQLLGGVFERHLLIALLKTPTRGTLKQDAVGNCSLTIYCAAQMLVRATNREIMEVDATGPDTISSSTVQLVPSAMDAEIQDTINLFWGQTEALAEQHARLNLQQHIQSNNQKAALMAVHANAEQGVNRLAAHQHETAVQMEHGVNRLAAHQHEVALQMERMLQETRKSMNEQIHALAHDQSVQADEKIQNVLLEAVAARQLALQQAAEAQRVENDMSTALSRMHADLTQRIDDARARPSDPAPVQLEERFQQLKNEIAAQVQAITHEIVDKNLVDVERRLQSKGPVSARVKRVVDETVLESESRIQQAMQLALQNHRNEMNAKLQQHAPVDDAVLRERVGEATDAAEQRIEERMRKALQDARADIGTEVKRHAIEQQRTKDELTTRIDQLSTRVTALESAPIRAAITATPPVSAATTMDGAQLSLAMAISEATQKIKILMDKSTSNARSSPKRSSRRKKVGASARPVPSAHTSTKIAAIVAKMQRDVQVRAEAAAKQYDTARQT